MSVETGSWTIERDYPHEPAAVFAAWSDPTVKVRWFDLSNSPDPEYQGDFRIGGRETFRTPAGASPVFTYDAEYRDIVPDERIVSTYEMAVDGARMSVSVASVEFLATTTGTRLRYTEQGAYLDDRDKPEYRRTGTGNQLDRLAEVLAAATS